MDVATDCCENEPTADHPPVPSSQFLTSTSLLCRNETIKGTVDFPAFVEVFKAINYEGWAIVEQATYPIEFDKPLPVAYLSREYLVGLGLG